MLSKLSFLGIRFLNRWKQSRLPKSPDTLICCGDGNRKNDVMTWINETAGNSGQWKTTSEKSQHVLVSRQYRISSLLGWLRHHENPVVNQKFDSNFFFTCLNWDIYNRGVNFHAVCTGKCKCNSNLNRSQDREDQSVFPFLGVPLVRVSFNFHWGLDSSPWGRFCQKVCADWGQAQTTPAFRAALPFAILLKVEKCAAFDCFSLPQRTFCRTLL